MMMLVVVPLLVVASSLDVMNNEWRFDFECLILCLRIC